MRGRYTRVLFDGLPLAGQQVGGLGLLQIPPMDLGAGRGDQGRGLGALRRGRDGRRDQPGRAARRRRSGPRGAVQSVHRGHDRRRRLLLAALVAAASRHAARPALHHQTKNDIDDDGWYDLPGYSRFVVRPRLFWDDGKARSGWLTVGLTGENRYGGAVSDALPPQLRAWITARRSIRRAVDVGGSYQEIFRDSLMFNGRVAGTLQRHEHVFGSTIERDRHTNVFAEASLRGAARPSHLGRRRRVRARVVRSARCAAVRVLPSRPGLFAQDDIRWSDWLTVSASARLDLHHTYGTFFSPRVVGADALERLDQPRLGGHRLFRVDAAHRGNRSGGPDAPVDAACRSKPKPARAIRST